MSFHNNGLRGRILFRLVAVAAFCVVGISATVNAARADFQDAAVASPLPAAIDEPYSPQPGVIFNNPAGTLDEQYAILNHIGASIDSAPKGSVIRIATWSFSSLETADKLIAAYRRGVRVKVLIDGHATTPAIKRLQSRLVKDKTKHSFVVICKYGCMSSRTKTYMHAKLFMFSTAGTSRRVVMIGSGNLTDTAAKVSWNNNVTVVNDLALYGANLRYFSHMLADKDRPNYYRTTVSGRYKEYFFPRTQRNRVTMYDALSRVKCAGAAPGYGSGGYTKIQVAMYIWTDLRASIARRLWELDNHGCRVEVLYTGGTVGPKVTKALLKRGGRFGGIPIYDGGVDRNRDGKWERYVHHKSLSVNGVYGPNKSTKMVFTGSFNFANNTERNNNEIILRVSGSAVYDAFSANFGLIRDKYATPVKKVPSPAIQRTRNGGERNLESLPGYDLEYGLEQLED